MAKDTNEKMAANMNVIDQLIEDMEDQVEVVQEVGSVTIKHKLINCMPTRHCRGIVANLEELRDFLKAIKSCKLSKFSRRRQGGCLKSRPESFKSQCLQICTCCCHMEENTSGAES